ncbi:MAG: deoxyribodipyrimidine photo-lyase, partial [Comamonadaceae bacterium]
MSTTYAAGLVWLRRDLRLRDNAALYHALTTCRQVHCAFLFDSDILAELPRADRRVEFIHDAVVALDASLQELASAGLLVLHGTAMEQIPRLASELGVQAVFANHDDEPRAIERDLAVRSALGAAGVALHTSKDQVIFEREEVLTQAGKPYSVFTPYSRAWLAKLDDFYVKAYPVERYAQRLAKGRQPVPTLAALGFKPTNLHDLPLGRGEA